VSIVPSPNLLPKQVTNRTRGARGGFVPLRTLDSCGDAKKRVSDTLADSRVQKPKNFLTFFSRLLPHPSTAKRKKKWKGNFWFCFAISSPKSSVQIPIYLRAFHYTFLHLMATEAPCYPRLVVALYSANHTQSPPHSPLASLALAASALCVFAL